MNQISPVQVPITTGVLRSFGHVRLSMAGMEFTGGFKSIKYNRTRDREITYSNSPDPIGKSLGENKYECSAVLYYDKMMTFLQTVANIAPGYGDSPFTIYVSYTGVNLVTYTDTIINCTIDKLECDNTQGTMSLTREIELHPTKIYWNGLEDLAMPLLAPPSP